MQISSRIAAVAESPTLALNAKAMELKSKGVDVVNFTVGEPDFDTPENVKQAAIDAIRSGFTKYTPVAGIPELRKAIAQKLKAENFLEYTPEQVIVSCGGKHALFNAFQALCNPNDEVIIPAPYWVTYPEQVKLAGAKPVFARTDASNGFRLKAEDIDRCVTTKTKAVIVNSPNNPTGAVYEAKELKKIASLAAEDGFYIISDEIYEHLVYDGGHASAAGFGKDARERTIIINGASKTYAMTGWRIGWAAGPLDVVKAMCRLQSQVTSNANSIAQKAYLEALTGTKEPLRAMAAEFRRRRDMLIKGLNAIDGITCAKPNGAFYAFPSIAGCLKGSIRNSMDFSMELLDKARVAVVPGSEFGAEGHIRISYACSTDAIAEGLKRIAEFVRSQKC